MFLVVEFYLRQTSAKVNDHVDGFRHIVLGHLVFLFRLTERQKVQESQFLVVTQNPRNLIATLNQNLLTTRGHKNVTLFLYNAK